MSFPHSSQLCNIFWNFLDGFHLEKKHPSGQNNTIPTSIPLYWDSLQFPTKEEEAGKIAGPTREDSLPDYKGQGEFPGPNCGGSQSSLDSFLFKHRKEERTFCLPAQIKTRFQQNLTTAHHGFAQQPVDQSQEHESKNCICFGFRQNKATCIITRTKQTRRVRRSALRRSSWGVFHLLASPETVLAPWLNQENR